MSMRKLLAAFGAGMIVLHLVLSGTDAGSAEIGRAHV